MTTYNGYTNRPTWLASLLLQNTSEAVYLEARETVKEPLAHVPSMLEVILLDRTNFRSESDGYINQINWTEVIESLKE